MLNFERSRTHVAGPLSIQHGWAPKLFGNSQNLNLQILKSLRHFCFVNRHLLYSFRICFIVECWENVYKATYKRDTVSAISAQLSGFAATMSTSTCRSSFMLALFSSAQYLFRKVHRRFARRRSSYVYNSPLRKIRISIA